MYYQIKGAIFGAVPASNDATHILLGYALFLITILVFRRSMKTWWAALPVVIVGTVMEVIDLIVGQSLAGALRDFILFALLPVITVLVYRMGWGK